MSKINKLHINKLFEVLEIDDRTNLKLRAKELGVKSSDLEYYNDNMILPDKSILNRILSYKNISELELKLRLGIIEHDVLDWISKNPQIILRDYNKLEKTYLEEEIRFRTKYGSLYKGDCISIMKNMVDESVDMIFADPPFNLDKQYESGIDDKVSEEEYLKFTEEWLLECVRILKPGGSLFVYHIPYWNTKISNILNRYLNFRHWISISLKGVMPVQNKLIPTHYSLLYYIKGAKPNVFNKQRIPMATCRHCGGEIHDYGGKKKTLDPTGLAISDVWTDINPVRHKKFKNREANELPLKLLYRVISLSTNENDIVFDPFGGSGTTYVVSEYLQRRWIGSEIGSLDDIVNRFNNIEKDYELLNTIDSESNVLFTNEQVRLREKNSFWGYSILNNTGNSNK